MGGLAKLAIAILEPQKPAPGDALLGVWPPFNFEPDFFGWVSPSGFVCLQVPCRGVNFASIGFKENVIFVQ